METKHFKSTYCLQRIYGHVSDSQIFCRIIVKNRSDNSEIMGLESKIKSFDVGEGLAYSLFSIHPISWEIYLNETIIVLFNLLMLRLNISDLKPMNDQKAIATFFEEDPFVEE